MAPLFGIVLSAGHGTRMGGPKASLRIGGRLLAELHAERLLEAGCRSVVVVTRPELLPLFSHDSVTIIGANTASPADSLALAIEQLGPAQSLVVVTPVDLLPASVVTIRRLVSAVQGDVLAASPTYRGQGGHPVVVSSSVLRGGPTPLRDRLQALGARRLRLEVDEPAILGDFDVPTDLPPAG